MRQDSGHAPTHRSPRAEAEALRHGGPEVLRDFHQAYAPVVLAWAIRLGEVGQDPEAISRATFRRVMRRLRRFDGEVPLLAFIFWQLQVELRHARWRAWWGRWWPATRSPLRRPSGAAEALHLRRRATVQQALSTLPRDLRAVVVLTELEGRSTDEVAVLLRCSAELLLARRLEAQPQLAALLDALGLLQGEGEDRAARIIPLPPGTRR